MKVSTIDPFNEGVEARAKDVSIDECPYKTTAQHDVERGASWRSGWRYADQLSLMSDPLWYIIKDRVKDQS